MKMPNPKERAKAERIITAQMTGLGSKPDPEDSRFMKKLAHNYPDWCASNGIVVAPRRSHTIRRD